MQLDTSTMLIFFVLFITGFYVFQVYSTRNRIWCAFRRADRTKIERWAKMGQRRIEFDGGWYDVEPDRTSLMIKWNPLPMWVRTLDFRHDSSRPLDPKTFENQYTPEARKQLDKADDIGAFLQGSKQAVTGKAGKKGILEQLFPIIVLVGFVIVGYMLWQYGQKINVIGFQGNNIQDMLHELLGH